MGFMGFRINFIGNDALTEIYIYITYLDTCWMTPRSPAGASQGVPLILRLMQKHNITKLNINTKYNRQVDQN
jgi:hypothetical protein